MSHQREPAGAPLTMRPARGRRRVALVGIASVVAVVLVVGGSNAWVRLASRGGVYDAADAPARPVGLVLGAGVFPDGTPQPFLAARLDLAADLLERGAVSRLVLTGDGRVDDHDEPAAMRAYLLARGVADSRLVLDTDGYDTYDSCARARRVYGLDEVTVVTQTYHLPRALAVCRAVGLRASGVGEETMREAYPGIWAQGESREILAAVKAAWDVLSRRDPVLTTTPAPARAPLSGGSPADRARG